MVVYDTRPSDICVPGFLFNPGLGGGNGKSMGPSLLMRNVVRVLGFLSNPAFGYFLFDLS